MGFLNPAAPTPLSGILLTLSSSVYGRLLLPADLPGGSKRLMVPHVHTTWGQHRTEIWCVVHSAQAQAQAWDPSAWTVRSSAQWQGRRQQPTPELGVQSVSKYPSISRKSQGLPERERRPPTNDELHMRGVLMNTSGCVVA